MERGKFVFFECRVSDDGDCGFRGLGLTRAEAVKLLLKQADVFSIRSLVAPEIRAAFLDKNLPLAMQDDAYHRLDTNYWQAQKAVDALTANLNNHLKFVDGQRLSPSALVAFLENATGKKLRAADATLSELYATFYTAKKTQIHAEVELDNYCQQETTYTSFIHEYLNKGGWLSYLRGIGGKHSTSTLDALAQLRTLEVIIWQQTAPKTLQCVHHFQPIERSSEIVHLFHTRNNTHYNLLIPAGVGVALRAQGELQEQKEHKRLALPGTLGFFESSHDVSDDSKHSQPKQANSVRRDLFIKILKQEFLKELQYFCDIKRDRAQARKTTSEKVITALQNIFEKIPIGGDAAKAMGSIVVVIANNKRDKKINAVVNIVDEIDLKRLEILLDLVGNEAFRRYESFIVDFLGDVHAVVDFAVVGAERIRNFLESKALQGNDSALSLGSDRARETKDDSTIILGENLTTFNLTENILLEGLIEGLSGSEASKLKRNHQLNLRPHTNGNKSTRKKISAETAYGHSGMRQFGIKECKLIHNKLGRNKRASTDKFPHYVKFLKDDQPVEPRSGFMLVPDSVINKHYSDHKHSIETTIEEVFTCSTVMVDRVTIESYLKEYVKNGVCTEGLLSYVRKLDHRLAKISRVVFRGSLAGLKLSGADLSYTDLCGVEIDSDVRKTNFSNSFLIGVQFKKSDQGPNLLNARGSNFKNARCECLEAEGVDFTGADLTQTNFSYAKLNRSIFIGCDQLDISLHKAELDDIKLNNYGEFFNSRRQEEESYLKLQENRIKRMEIIQQLCDKQKDFEEKIQKLHEEKVPDSKECNISGIKKRLDELGEKIENLMEQQKRNIAFKEYCEKEFKILSEASRDDISKQKKIQAELDQIKEWLNELEEREEGVAKNFRETNEEIQKIKQKLSEFGEKYNSLKRHVEALGETGIKLAQNITDQQNQLKALVDEVQRLQNVVSKIKSDIDNIQYIRPNAQHPRTSLWPLLIVACLGVSGGTVLENRYSFWGGHETESCPTCPSRFSIHFILEILVMFYLIHKLNKIDDKVPEPRKCVIM